MEFDDDRGREGTHDERAMTEDRRARDHEARNEERDEEDRRDINSGAGAGRGHFQMEPRSSRRMRDDLPIRARRRQSSMPLPARPASSPEDAMPRNLILGDDLENDEDNDEFGVGGPAMRRPLRRTRYMRALATRTAPPSREQNLPNRLRKQRRPCPDGRDAPDETREEQTLIAESAMPTTTATATATTTATRPLLVWNAPSEESDSGWSSASRRRSSSVLSSSSSFDSEPSLVTSYGRRTWYERQTTDEDETYHENLEGVEEEEGEEEEEEDHYARYADGESVMMRRMFHSVMHGVVLALQSLAALAVLSVFVWMTVWKNPDAEPAFWAWLWQVPSMATTSVLVLCVVTMITHEVRVLSALALLYLQAAILFMTSVSALIMWIAVAGRSGEIVQSIMVGCCAFLWGMACLGFLRAVVIWRVMEFEEGGMATGLLRDVETYGTIG